MNRTDVNESGGGSAVGDNGQEPTNPAALHALALEHAQRGEHALAVQLLGRAIAMRPGVPAFHVDLAEAHRNLGEWSRAIGCCRMALGLRSDYPEARNTLGLTLQGMGNIAGAVEEFQRALAIRPGMVPALNNLGVVLQELGQVDEAIEQFRRAVELEPDLFRVRTNLGLALVNRGRTEAAVPHLQEAARLEPDMAVLHRNLGDALRTLDRYEEARSAYLEATRLDPDRAENYRDVGMTLWCEGQLGGAVPWLKQAAEHDPENPSRWEELAGLYAERDDFAEAIPCWERVLALSPVKQAGTYNDLGRALQEEGRLAEARENYHSALQLQPALAPALLHLGAIHEELGEMAEAEDAFRAALRAQPRFPLPYARLATLLRDKLPDADLAALEERLADPRLPPTPRPHLLFGLAHVLDARGDYARAAECLREANALSLEQARGERAYVPADHERVVDGLMREFHPEFFARLTGTGLDTRRPVFVFGLPRSGTTLIEQILASHPLVHGAGELRLARQSFEDIPSVLDRPLAPIEGVPHLNAQAIRRLAQEHLDRLGGLDGDRAERIVNKMPDNYMHLGLLALLFPDATFIHCRRDLRDVAVSCWMTDFRSIRWANAPVHIASRFGEYRRIMEHWSRVLPVTVHEVHYEDTVSDLESVARRLLSAAGLEWDPACLEFHRTQRSVRTASVTQVRQPIYKRSVARWKNYEGELAELFAMLTPDDAADR
ncbi:MAG: tetratricopeptide repeat protein [Isosphaeraceae bacterium]|nr:tetratricopeptide repeat protein [Isosphaeraceae bacterium]